MPATSRRCWPKEADGERAGSDIARRAWRPGPCGRRCGLATSRRARPPGSCGGRAAGGGVQGRGDRLGEAGPGVLAARAKHGRRRDVKPDEDDFGSCGHDTPDRRVADCERVPEPLPEEVAHTRKVRGPLPRAPMFFQKGRDIRCSYPSLLRKGDYIESCRKARSAGATGPGDRPHFHRLQDPTRRLLQRHRRYVEFFLHVRLRRLIRRVCDLHYAERRALEGIGHGVPLSVRCALMAARMFSRPSSRLVCSAAHRRPGCRVSHRDRC